MKTTQRLLSMAFASVLTLTMLVGIDLLARVDAARLSLWLATSGARLAF